MIVGIAHEGEAESCLASNGDEIGQWQMKVTLF